MNQEEVEWIQVSNERGLRYLERFTFRAPVNSYTKRKDKSGKWLLRIGHEDSRGRYSGHRYIVRCMTGELLGEAEIILRRKLGFPDRVVPDSGPSM